MNKTNKNGEHDGIDAERLASYLDPLLPGGAGDLSFSCFSGGKSNPTYALSAGGRRYVLRSRPPGKLLASAHAIDREYRIMSALSDTRVPVPTMRHYCANDSIIGTPFYVMDHIDGRIFRDPRLPDCKPEERQAIYDDMNRVLRVLHDVDLEAVGLTDFGRPKGYLERQITRWTTQYRDANLSIPAMDILIEWLPAHRPETGVSTIAHGDYRLENLIVHPTEPRVLAVLDWELSTLGDPLADLAYNCMPYHMSIPMQPGFVGRLPEGIPAEAAYVALYANGSDRQISDEDWAFYMAFSLFRLAAICAGIYVRAQAGTAVSRDAGEFLNHADTIARAGVRAAQGEA